MGQGFECLKSWSKYIYTIQLCNSNGGIAMPQYQRQLQRIIIIVVVWVVVTSINVFSAHHIV